MWAAADGRPVGSVVARLQGANDPGLPAYVNLPRALGLGKAAYLGASYNPFSPESDPNSDGFQVRNLKLPGRVDGSRLDRRGSLLGQLDQIRRDIDLNGDIDGLDTFYRDALQMVRLPKGEGASTGETNHPYAIVIRDTDHPITQGIPREWMHAKDQLMHNLRGPAEDVRILATAFCPQTKLHEPIVWTVEFGKGRIVQTPMGHNVFAMRCVGFIATLQRSAEWAATGNTSLALPEDFPTADTASQRPIAKK